MIDNISIKGLRGFGVEQTINFAIPNDKVGSGLTFIVGANNSGKTTIMESLRAFNSTWNDPPSFSERKRNVKSDNRRIALKLETVSGSVYSISTVEHGGSQTDLAIDGIADEAQWNPPDIFVLQSRRYVEYEFHKNETDRKNYMYSQQMNYQNRAAIMHEFNARLFSMFRNKSDFDPILKKVLGYDLNWTIEKNDNGSFYLKLIINGHEHSSEGLGDGIWSVFTICDALYDSKEGDIIVIDEPELSLHPAYQKKIMTLFKEYAKDRQIIINTHSPYFIDIPSIVNGANLCRTVKNEEGDIEVYGISSESKESMEGFLRDINQPHTLGTEAKELFFLEEKIVLVEGQEDVVMYNLAAEKLGIEIPGNFFGWGAGGASKIPKLLNILNELGYKKVAVIYDGDKEEDKKREEQLHENYYFCTISTADVRDKPAMKAKDAKEGLMTRGGNLNPNGKLELPRLFEDIKNYML